MILSTRVSRTYIVQNTNQFGQKIILAFYELKIWYLTLSVTYNNNFDSLFFGSFLQDYLKIILKPEQAHFFKF